MAKTVPKELPAAKKLVNIPRSTLGAHFPIIGKHAGYIQPCATPANILNIMMNIKSNDIKRANGIKIVVPEEIRTEISNKFLGPSFAHITPPNN